ncbi:hydroxymethylglutaryl-CoA reductase [Sulfurivirga sp.]|uniref:hydroxymethylglutaryl-CoA reductase n=1 Tax=Sulfurivirga sp. TaxID=2614236 RepID=UPI0025E73B45|nr:hydroxymethylglutaryl-CoA reductase [Sulfurivirga sp.]
MTDTLYATIPMQWVGPLRLTGDLDAEVQAPMATYETPLWPSVNRGARVTAHAGGIRITLVDARMSRSITLQAPDAGSARDIAEAVTGRLEDLQTVVAETSRFARLIDVHPKIIGNLLILRLDFTTGDASGHNMVTNAADRLIPWLLEQYPALQYVSISGNFCTDKKVSAVNSLHGRGKYVVAECVIPERLVRRFLKTTPHRLVDLHIKKDLLGSIAAGSLMSANAHAANMLLAFYLATGQDAANIVEGSQCINHAEVTPAGDLYFSTTLPNLIVGTVGNGKGLDFVRDNLSRMGCLEERAPGENARRLAAICAATVLCGELSLLAAQTNPGELMAAHLKLERQRS